MAAFVLNINEVGWHQNLYDAWVSDQIRQYCYAYPASAYKGMQHDKKGCS